MNEGATLSRMATKARGRMVFWEGASLWIFGAPPGERYPKTTVHSHHVIQVTIALRGRVEFESGSRHLGGQAIAVGPDAPHDFEASEGALVAMLFIAPDGQAGRAIARGLFAKAPLVSLQLGEFSERLRVAFEKPRLNEAELCELGRQLVTRLAGEFEAAPSDPRIEKLMPWVAARLEEPVTLVEVAEFVELSPGRTRHLFVQQTGLPFRTWLLWLRLESATKRFAAGASLTEAAHGAGFADSAHLSRTFRRMFGINAASLTITESTSRRA